MFTSFGYTICNLTCKVFFTFEWISKTENKTWTIYSTRLFDFDRILNNYSFVHLEYFDNINNCAYSGVQPTALTAQCSDRLVILAQPKKKPIDYIDVDKQAHISDRMSDSARKNKQK
jgi:hypothetical protein